MITKRKPFPHQLEAADFLKRNKKVILGDEMGLGKTTSTIVAMKEIKGAKLIVCPASLKLNWQKEILLNYEGEEVILINSGKNWKKPKKGQWVIINYDILKNYLNEIKKTNFSVVAFDEAHYCKSINNNGHGGTKRARSFIQVANSIEHVFILTGTPITNKTKDIFNLLKAIKHPLSKNFKEFAKRYCNPEFNGFGYTYDGSSNQEELNERIKPYMMRRKKEELLQLPDKIRNFIPVEVNVHEYNRKVKEYMDQRGTFQKKNEHLVHLNAMRHILAKEKTKHTIKLIENLMDQDRPVVVFTNYTSVVQSIKEKFPHAVTVTGSDNEKEREEAIQGFQKGKKDLIICNLIAGGVGITLTRSCNTIINDMDWNPANHLQAEDRTHRIGQNQSVIAEYVYAHGTFDDKIAELLEAKLININKIIDNTEEGFIDEVIKWF